MSKINQHKNTLLLIGGALLFLITALFSEGFYHGDEHFQIIEFAQYKLGNTAAMNLPWEFHAQIRPTLQPIIAMSIFYVCDVFSVIDPYSKSFALRLITAAFAFYSILYFIRSVKYMIKLEYRSWFLFLALFLWFIPFLNVRFSSETWSGITLLLSISVLLKQKKEKRHYFIAGILIGLSFLFRFQIGFAIIGIISWMIFINKNGLQSILAFILGSGLVLAFGFAIDSWFYGEFTFTPWNYFDYNILQGKADEFGRSPWYYYFYGIFKSSFFPIGLVIILSLLKLTVTQPKHLILWIILPFLILHSVVGHKELRFLFPLVNLIPLMIILTVQNIKSVRSHSNKLMIFILIAINSIALGTASLTPAGNGETKITKTLHQKAKGHNIVYYVQSDPFSPWGLPMYFYDPIPDAYKISTADSLMKLLQLDHDLLICARNKYISDPEFQHIVATQKLEAVSYSVHPNTSILFNLYGKKTDEYFTIFESQSTE